MKTKSIPVILWYGCDSACVAPENHLWRGQETDVIDSLWMIRLRIYPFSAAANGSQKARRFVWPFSFDWRRQKSMCHLHFHAHRPRHYDCRCLAAVFMMTNHFINFTAIYRTWKEAIFKDFHRTKGPWLKTDKVRRFIISIFTWFHVIQNVIHASNLLCLQVPGLVVTIY